VSDLLGRPGPVVGPGLLGRPGPVAGPPDLLWFIGLHNRGDLGAPPTCAASSAACSAGRTGLGGQPAAGERAPAGGL